jgi:uncharacterized protein involved in response to NO
MRRPASILGAIASFSRSDPDQQPALLSYGFRPFFLAAGLYAVVAMVAWMGWLGLHNMHASVNSPSISMAPHLWHGHEMLFGYASAAAAGFMLTAVPSWTGARRVAGLPLLLLALLWIAGRAAVWFSAWIPPLVVALIDLSFLPLLTMVMAAGLMLRPQPRNLVFLGLLAALAVANLQVHLEWMEYAVGDATQGLASAVMIFSLMVVIVGGRVVPSFTRNALIRLKTSRPLPVSSPAIDRLSVLSATMVAGLSLAAAPDRLLALACAAAAAFNAIRMIRWQTVAVIGQPILWSLHLAYGLLVAGYAAVAADKGFGLSGFSGQHLLGVGALGCMTLAIMTRAALGHTGRALEVRPIIAAAYLLVAAAAVVRGVGAYLVPQHYFGVMFLAGGLWILAFSAFAVVYFPILIQQRQFHTLGD